MSDTGPLRVLGYAVAALLALVLFIVVIFGAVAGIKAFGRHQAIADENNKVKTSQINANNQVKLTNIQIGTTAQQVKIAQQEAQIREAQAIGIRQAQDEISKTLTPLYVQFEMVDALKQIAESGKNNTVVYIPSGANGIPLVSGAAGAPAVGTPAQ